MYLIKFLKRFSLAVFVGFCFFIFGSGSPAYADSVVQLQQKTSNRILEVWQSSPNDGAVVDAYPWNGTATQYWWIGEVTTSGATVWYKFTNYNSSRTMDAYNSTCIVHQYGMNASTTQYQRHWRFGTWESDGSDTTYQFNNRNGCTDDIYRDRLFSWGVDNGIYKVSISRFYAENPSWTYMWRISYY